MKYAFDLLTISYTWFSIKNKSKKTTTSENSNLNVSQCLLPYANNYLELLKNVYVKQNNRHYGRYSVSCGLKNPYIEGKRRVRTKLVFSLVALEILNSFNQGLVPKSFLFSCSRSKLED